MKCLKNICTTVAHVKNNALVQDSYNFWYIKEMVCNLTLNNISGAVHIFNIVTQNDLGMHGT